MAGESCSFDGRTCELDCLDCDLFGQVRYRERYGKDFDGWFGVVVECVVLFDCG